MVKPDDFSSICVAVAAVISIILAIWGFLKPKAGGLPPRPSGEAVSRDVHEQIRNLEAKARRNADDAVSAHYAVHGRPQEALEEHRK